MNLVVMSPFRKCLVLRTVSQVLCDPLPALITHTLVVSLNVLCNKEMFCKTGEGKGKQGKGRAQTGLLTSARAKNQRPQNHPNCARPKCSCTHIRRICVPLRRNAPIAPLPKCSWSYIRRICVSVFLRLFTGSHILRIFSTHSAPSFDVFFRVTRIYVAYAPPRAGGT